VDSKIEHLYDGLGCVFLSKDSKEELNQMEEKRGKLLLDNETTWR